MNVEQLNEGRIEEILGRGDNMGKDVEVRYSLIRERNRINFIFLEGIRVMLRSLIFFCRYWGLLNILNQDGNIDLYFIWD